MSTSRALGLTPSHHVFHSPKQRRMSRTRAARDGYGGQRRPGDVNINLPVEARRLTYSCNKHRTLTPIRAQRSPSTHQLIAYKQPRTCGDVPRRPPGRDKRSTHIITPNAPRPDIRFHRIQYSNSQIHFSQTFLLCDLASDRARGAGFVPPIVTLRRASRAPRSPCCSPWSSSSTLGPAFVASTARAPAPRVAVHRHPCRPPRPPRTSELWVKRSNLVRPSAVHTAQNAEMSCTRSGPSACPAAEWDVAASVSAGAPAQNAPLRQTQNLVLAHRAATVGVIARSRRYVSSP